MADEQYRWLDSDTAERLLSGESPDVVEPADRERAPRHPGGHDRHPELDDVSDLTTSASTVAPIAQRALADGPTAPVAGLLGGLPIGKGLPTHGLPLNGIPLG
nr:hypothetical protein [Streptomyces acidiscabies]